MSKRKSRSAPARSKSSARSQAAKAARSNTAAQSADLLTVNWMLSVMTTLLCEVGFLLARAYVLFVDSEAHRMGVLSGMMLFAACVIGLISLGMCAAVVRYRKPRPPQSVILCAVVICVLPLVVAAIINLRPL